MTIPFYQVDAFTDSLFGGNPAGVCLLKEWPGEWLMQQIAMENNLAETAFVVESLSGFEIRWFTPAVEVDLCGHATLAAAKVIFTQTGYFKDSIEFYSHRSGFLRVNRHDYLLTLDFPADEYSTVPVLEQLWMSFGRAPVEMLKGKTDYVFVYENQSIIENLKPDIREVMNIPNCRGVIVTAPGDKVDFVSRFFAPQVGIEEDPVTGSAHTTLTPYWASKLGKTELSALQLSPRGGQLQCALSGSRVLIAGEAQIYLKGELIIDPY